MTKYSCRKNGEGIALFADDVPLSAMITFAQTVCEICHEDVDVIDMDNGELVFLMKWEDEEEPEPDYEPDVDESSYNPYMGCDEIEDDRLDDFCIESEWQY